MNLTSRVLQIADPLWEEAWVDGLPVVPPTPERVMVMLAGTDRQPDELLGLVPPRMGKATVEKVAINAVMAGCKPEYLPVVLAAVEAVLHADFNLNGVIATTHCCTPLIVVNGPIVSRIDLSGGTNCFGQGFRANATIGRVLRLVLHNIGGAEPGLTDKATFGHPGKYTYCIAENELRSPWPSFAAERGFAAHTNTVTVFAAEAPHSVSDHVSLHGKGIATTFADSMATMGSNNMYAAGETMVVVSPEHVTTLHGDGWSKDDLRAFLFEHARRSVRDLKRGGMFSEEFRRRYWPRWIGPDDDDAMVPVVRRPEDIHVVVAGGDAGKFSMVIPGWGDFGTRAITLPVR